MSRSLYSAFRCGNSALHFVKHVRHRSCTHLRRTFHWVDPYLFAGPTSVLVWDCPTHRHWTATDCRNDYRRHRCGNSALVHLRIRSDRERHAGALRPASPPRYRRTVPVRAKPDVYRRHPWSCRRRNFLRLTVALDLRRVVFACRSPVRRRLRGTDLAKIFRRRVRSVLPASQALDSRPNSALPFKN